MDLLPFTRPSIGPEEEAAVAAVLASGWITTGPKVRACEAAVGLSQLPKLDGFNAKRRELARHYLERLSHHQGLVLPQDVPGHSWHRLCVCIDFAAFRTDRASLMAALRGRGIQAGIPYYEAVLMDDGSRDRSPMLLRQQAP